jgi:hypothetical protein
MTFSNRRMAKMADRVFDVVTIDEQMVSVKVLRDKHRGNSVWKLEPVTSFDGLDVDQIWHGEEML